MNICVYGGSSVSLDKKYIEGNLRISFSRYNNFDEIEVLSDELVKTVKEYLDKV